MLAHCLFCATYCAHNVGGWQTATKPTKATFFVGQTDHFWPKFTVTVYLFAILSYNKKDEFRFAKRIGSEQGEVMFNFLVVEDDANTRKLLAAVLKGNGYNPILSSNGVEALEALESNHVDLMIIDVMMPKMDGYELTKTLRESGSQIPMLMLSAKQKSEDIKQGFIVGIDDYMTKPFDVEELLLRIRALLRRSKIATEQKLTVGNVTLDYNSYTVTTPEGSDTLPQKEFLLLFKLLSYPNVVFTRLQLMDEIWGMDAESDEHTVNVHINRLRTRFANVKDFEILTIRGLGYKAVRYDE